MLSNHCVTSLEKANKRRAYNRAYYKIRKERRSAVKKIAAVYVKVLGSNSILNRFVQETRMGNSQISSLTQYICAKNLFWYCSAYLFY